MPLILTGLRWLTLLVVGLVALNIFVWALLTFLPYALLAIIVILCIIAGAVRARYFY